MPAIATHYKYGQLVLDRLPSNIRTTVTSHKSLFDIGTQGPDPLFYYNPLKQNSIGFHGSNLHNCSAFEFFRDAHNRGNDRSAMGLSLLLGICCHFGLDMKLHPYVIEMSDNDGVEHRSIETDLDANTIARYKMEAKRYVYIPRNVDSQTFAEVFCITQNEARKALFNMHYYTLLLDHPKLIILPERLIVKKPMFSSLALKKEIQYKQEVEQLSKLFDDSIDNTVMLLQSLYNFAKSDTPLHQDFTYNFLGDELDEEQIY